MFRPRREHGCSLDAWQGRSGGCPQRAPIQTCDSELTPFRNSYSKLLFELSIRTLYSNSLFELSIRNSYSKAIFETHIRTQYSKFYINCIVLKDCRHENLKKKLRLTRYHLQQDCRQPILYAVFRQEGFNVIAE